MNTWKVILINHAGIVMGEELINKDWITTKDIGELHWELRDGDKLVVELVN